jgi:hypothetical protein
MAWSVIEETPVMVAVADSTEAQVEDEVPLHVAVATMADTT